MHLRGNTEGLHVRRIEAQETAHPHRHALPSVPLPRKARIDQLRWFDHWLKGIDTGIMDEPPVKLEIRTGGSGQALQVPLRERVAARAHAVDEALSQHRPRADRRRDAPRAEAVPRRSRCDDSSKRHDQGQHRVGSSRRAAGQAAARRVLRDAADEAGHRDHRPDRAEPVGLEHGGGHGHLRDASATSAPTARTCSRWASGRAAAMRDQGLAARVAPQARSGEVAAVSARITRTTSAGGSSRARSSNARSRSGRPRMVFRKGHKHTPRHPAARRRRQRALHALHADYNIGAHNTVYSGGDKASYLLLPIVPAKGS